MTELTLDAIWETMENSLIGLESGLGDQSQLTLAVRGSLQMLLSFPPAEVVAKASASALPPRSLLSWLVFEAGRLSGVDQERVAALADCWRTRGEQAPELITPSLARQIN
jgi:hypothetical protein